MIFSAAAREALIVDVCSGDRLGLHVIVYRR
jgi:hypothetical protein